MIGLHALQRLFARTEATRGHCITRNVDTRYLLLHLCTQRYALSRLCPRLRIIVIDNKRAGPLEKSSTNYVINSATREYNILRGASLNFATRLSLRSGLEVVSRNPLSSFVLIVSIEFPNALPRGFNEL